MAMPTTASNENHAGAGPTVVLQDAYTWVSMPLDPPANVVTGYPGGSPAMTKSIRVQCTNGTLGISFKPDGSAEQQIAAGQVIDIALGIQGFRVRGVGAAATYEYIATLK